MEVLSGLLISWRLSSLGFDVYLYDAGKVLQQTSSTSSKLLHGGMRYLEHGHLRLVREFLLDKFWWLKNVSQHSRPIEISMPVYNDSPRSLLTLFAGALLYRILSGRYSLGPTRWRGKRKRQEDHREISDVGLRGSVIFL